MKRRRNYRKRAFNFLNRPFWSQVVIPRLKKDFISTVPRVEYPHPSYEVPGKERSVDILSPPLLVDVAGQECLNGSSSRLCSTPRKGLSGQKLQEA